jgi:hypothetical protein
MIPAVNRRVVFIHEHDRFATRVAQLLNEFPRFHDSQYAALKKGKGLRTQPDNSSQQLFNILRVVT